MPDLSWMTLLPQWVLPVLTGLVLTGKWLLPRARKLGHLMDDLVGQPERPGVDARPGLLSRVKTLEEDSQKIRVRLDLILKEVTPNGGSSMRDAVTRLESKIDATPSEGVGA